MTGQSGIFYPVAAGLIIIIQHSISLRIQSAHQGGPGWPTKRKLAVRLGEFYPLLRQSVQIGSVLVYSIIGPNLSIQIVGYNE